MTVRKITYVFEPLIQYTILTTNVTKVTLLGSHMFTYSSLHIGIYNGETF